MILETVARPHYYNLPRWAADRPEVLVLSADLTSSCEADGFREAHPGRFFSMGMAEQNMMSFAAGLAREGFVPYVHTFSVFVTRRPFDQVAMSIAYPNLPVKLLGFVPGLTTPGGVTHQAIDDVALMRAMPNMTVLECGDATEVEGALDAAHAIAGPVYLRMLRGAVPRLFPEGEPLRLGEPRVLSQGDDVLLLTSGICTAESIRATAALARRGVSLTHLHLSTIRPLDFQTLAQPLARASKGVITVENHLTSGGLGSALAELMAEAGLGVPLVRLGLQDTYAHGASCAYLLREYGLDALAVARAVERLAGLEPALREEDLLPLPDVSGQAPVHKAEDL